MFMASPGYRREGPSGLFSGCASENSLSAGSYTYNITFISIKTSLLCELTMSSEIQQRRRQTCAAETGSTQVGVSCAALELLGFWAVYRRTFLKQQTFTIFLFVFKCVAGIRYANIIKNLTWCAASVQLSLAKYLLAKYFGNTVEFMSLAEILKQEGFFQCVWMLIEIWKSWSVKTWVFSLFWITRHISSVLNWQRCCGRRRHLHLLLLHLSADPTC